VNRTAIGFSTGALLFLIVVVVTVRPPGLPLWTGVAISLAVAGAIYAGLTRKPRRRRKILSRPFPAEWEAVLQREVVFYRALESSERERFRRELQVFLGEKRITGIETDVDTTTRVLAAASAIIPIFGFPEWEWDQITEILIYPARFDQDFSIGDDRGHRTLGMVGSGFMNGLMILVKPDLIQGFRNPGDKRSVGLHEFAHLVDKSDGTIDGLPGVGLDRQSIGPWIELVRRKMEEMRRGKSDINRYGLTNEAEFFAVASEYFFERPGVMRRKHPELYAMLSRIFHQSLHERAAAMAREAARGRRRFGRNSPCPCGSGVKYKKCCLRRARSLIVAALFLALQFAPAEGGANASAPWQPLLDWLSSERNRMSGDLATAHETLLARAQAEGDEGLAMRLSPDPPRPRPGGYGILPEILDDESVEPIEPTQRTYSLERLSVDFATEFRDAAVLAGRAASEPDLPLDPAVSEFERLRAQMRTLEDHLDYHSKWQPAVVEHREFFSYRNQIVELVREMELARDEGGKTEQVDQLRATVLDRIASFTPAPDLALERREDGTRALPVTVWTDIEDEAFLDAFREIVEASFSTSAAARSMRFTLELQLRRVPAAELYPEGAPARGATLDLSRHQDRFPERGLILTTGAEDTHAWQGRSVLLGSAPLSRNALAHEFAHLLGFGDAYLRGFDGSPGGPFGVVLVEWTGLVGDLMGWPDGGSVSKRMIARLIEAYGSD